MIAVKMRLRFAFLLLLAMSPILAGAEEETGRREVPPYMLRVKDGVVEVHRPEGNHIPQLLPYAGERPDGADEEFFTFAVDMNFDGIPDVAVLFSRGAQNIYYDAWLWDKDAGVFVKYGKMNGVSNPGFDAEQKRVTSFTHISATYNSSAEYAWEDGRLVLMEETIQDFSPHSETFSVRSDSADEFTAVRHFAVDAAGLVYAKVAAEDTEYRRVGGALPMWVGLFRKDGILLEIGMYREGPLGYYFGGLFSGEGIEDRQVLAAVDGRIASEEHLSFVLDDDDSAITVSVNDAADEALQQFVGRYVESADEEEEEDTEDSGGLAEVEIPLVNKLGYRIATLRTDWGGDPFATDVADGATVLLDDVAWAELRGGCSLLVKNAEDENDAAPPLLFLHEDFPDEADSLALDVVDGIPELQFFEDGRQIDAVIAGLPLEYLLYGLEPGMEPGKYAEYMMPLEADGWESYPFAVRTGISSWRLLPPGPVFTEDADGVKRLSSVSFGQDNRRINITIDTAGAFGGRWHYGQWLAAKTAEEGKGLAGRYVLNDDGTFVRASSDFTALEQERELFAAGTWTVRDNELLLSVRERWMLPVGGVEQIVPDDMTTIVNGDVVKVLFNPPEKEVYPIARAKKDPETDRLAITIDGTTFYKFDDRADFLGRYNELRRAQKIDFSNLKNIIFTFSSGAGAWRTTLAIQPDGRFNGQYSDANMGEQGPGYPDGTVYVGNFSGAFSSLEKVGESGLVYTLKCGKLSREGAPGEEKIIDGVKYVNAPPYGLESAAGADGIMLFLPGTPYDQLPESYLKSYGIEFADGEIPVLEESMLYFPDDGDFHGAPGEGSDYRFYDIDWTGDTR